MSKAVYLAVKKLPCVVCGEKRVDACHIRSKGAGGGFELWNLYPGCRLHHQEQHRIGIVSFYRKYPSVKRHFEELGWRVEDCVGKERMWNDKLEGV